MESPSANCSYKTAVPPTVRFLLLFVLLASPALPQTDPKPERGSIIEDRAARKLLQAGDARLEVGENEKALEIWESVIER